MHGETGDTLNSRARMSLRATWPELAAGRTGRFNGDYDFALGVALFEVTGGFGCVT